MSGSGARPEVSGSGSGSTDTGAAGLLRRWPTIVALVAMWIALWGALTPANVVGGVAVALSVLLVTRRVQPRPVHHFRVGPALRYLATFARLLVVANYQVVLAVLLPRRVHPGIIALPLHDVSDAVVTLVANSITLTPGTLTLEAERRPADLRPGRDAEPGSSRHATDLRPSSTVMLYVHALDVTDAERVRDDIRLLATLAADAFGSADARAHARMAGVDGAGGADPAARDQARDRPPDDTRGRTT